MVDKTSRVFHNFFFSSEFCSFYGHRCTNNGYSHFISHNPACRTLDIDVPLTVKGWKYLSGNKSSREIDFVYLWMCPNLIRFTIRDPFDNDVGIFKLEAFMCVQPHSHHVLELDVMRLC